MTLTWQQTQETKVRFTCCVRLEAIPVHFIAQASALIVSKIESICGTARVQVEVNEP